MIIQRQEEDAMKLLHMLKSKAKPRIISVERILPSIVTKPPSQLIKALPRDIQAKAMEMKNEANRAAMLERLRFSKSEEGVAKAVESITAAEAEFAKNSPAKSAESTMLSPTGPGQIDENSSMKHELVRAIRSITRLGGGGSGGGSPGSSPANDESSNEGNLRLVLEEGEVEDGPDDEKKVLDQSGASTHSHNTRYSARHKQFDVSNASLNGSAKRLLGNGVTEDYREYDREFVFDEANYQKQRRKRFSEKEMSGHLIAYKDDNMGEWGPWVTPTTFDITFNQAPKRKKRVTKAETAAAKRKLAEVKEEMDAPAAAAGTNNNRPIKDAGGRLY